MPRKCGVLERISTWATKWTGSSLAFALAAGVIVVWGVTGPVFGFSDTWQLVINTGTTIVTFLMVFLIQRGQNKDAMAIQLKLNELVAAVEGASNRLINVEDLTEDEVKVLHEHYCTLVKLAKADEKLTESHSVEDAQEDHAAKRNAWKRRRGVGRPLPMKEPERAAHRPGSCQEGTGDDGFRADAPAERVAEPG